MEIQDVSARGSGENIAARVDFTIDGGPPPDGDSPRYYRLSHPMVTGWRVKRETTAFSYYAKLF